MTIPGGDIDARKKAEAEQRRRQRLKEIADIKLIVETPTGRRVLMRILDLGKAFAPTYVPNSDESAYNEGQRSVATAILKDITLAKPTALAQMQREAANNKSGGE